MVASFSFSARFTEFQQFFSEHRKALSSQRFNFKANRKSIGSTKKEVLRIFKLALRLRDRHTLILKLEKPKFFSKNGTIDLEQKVQKLKTQHFHTKQPCQKPMLKQIEWRVQNGLITKSRVLPVTTTFLQKFCFCLRTWHKELHQSPYSYFPNALEFNLRMHFSCEPPLAKAKLCNRNG